MQARGCRVSQGISVQAKEAAGGFQSARRRCMRTEFSGNPEGCQAQKGRMLACSEAAVLSETGGAWRQLVLDVCLLDSALSPPSIPPHSLPSSSKPSKCPQPNDQLDNSTLWDQNFVDILKFCIISFHFEHSPT